MKWTPELVAALETLARRRVSIDDITATLSVRHGIAVSRAAVASKAWREGIQFISSDYAYERSLSRD